MPQDIPSHKPKPGHAGVHAPGAAVPSLENEMTDRDLEKLIVVTQNKQVRMVQARPAWLSAGSPPAGPCAKVFSRAWVCTCLVPGRWGGQPPHLQRVCTCALPVWTPRQALVGSCTEVMGVPACMRGQASLG